MFINRFRMCVEYFAYHLACSRRNPKKESVCAVRVNYKSNKIYTSIPIFHEP